MKTSRPTESTYLRELSTWNVNDLTDYVFYLVYIWGIPVHYKYVVCLLQQCLCNKPNTTDIKHNSEKSKDNEDDEDDDDDDDDVAIVEVIDETQGKSTEFTNNWNSNNNNNRWADRISCTSSLEEMEQFVRTDLFYSIVERGDEANNKIDKCKSLIRHYYSNNNEREIAQSHIVLLSLASNCCKEQTVTNSEVNTSIRFNVKVLCNKRAEANNEEKEPCKAEVIALHSTFLENNNNSSDSKVNWAEAAYWTAMTDVYNLEKDEVRKSHSINSFTTIPRLQFNQAMEYNSRPKCKNTKRVRESVNTTKELNKKADTKLHKNNITTLFSKEHRNQQCSTTLPALSPITLITQSNSQNSKLSDVHIVDEEKESQSASHSIHANDSDNVIVISDDDDDVSDSYHV